MSEANIISKSKPDDLDSVVTLFATIVSINSAEKTAIVEYRDDCYISLGIDDSIGLDFLFNCPGYTGYGHTAFSVDDEVYIFHYLSGLNVEKTLIAGHCHKDIVPPCRGDFVLLRLAQTLGSGDDERTYSYRSLFDVMSGSVVNPSDYDTEATFSFPCSYYDCYTFLYEFFTPADIDSPFQSSTITKTIGDGYEDYSKDAVTEEMSIAEKEYPPPDECNGHPFESLGREYIDYTVSSIYRKKGLGTTSSCSFGGNTTVEPIVHKRVYVPFDSDDDSYYNENSICYHRYGAWYIDEYMGNGYVLDDWQYKYTLYAAGVNNRDDYVFSSALCNINTGEYLLDTVSVTMQETYCYNDFVMANASFGGTGERYEKNSIQIEYSTYKSSSCYNKGLIEEEEDNTVLLSSENKSWIANPVDADNATYYHYSGSCNFGFPSFSVEETDMEVDKSFGLGLFGYYSLRSISIKSEFCDDLSEYNMPGVTTDLYSIPRVYRKGVVISAACTLYEELEENIQLASPSSIISESNESLSQKIADAAIELSVFADSTIEQTDTSFVTEPDHSIVSIEVFTEINSEE